jgi:hypothetical protein
MKMEMTITRTSNVDYNKMRVIDESKIQVHTLDWEDTVEIFDVKENIMKYIQVKNISLHNDRLVMFNDQWQILCAFSK